MRQLRRHELNSDLVPYVDEQYNKLIVEDEHNEMPMSC